MIIQKAYKEDFGKIYPVLNLFNNKALTINDWQNLFVKYWESDRDYFGYYIEENNEVAGFIGLIFADRIISDTKYTFCNMTSWIVRPEYRKFSLHLFYQALSEENVIFTNITPNPSLFEILKRFEFHIVDDYFIFTFPFFFAKLLPGGASFSSGLELIKSKITQFEKGILDDHKNTKVHPFIIYNEKEYCLIMVSRQYKKRMPVSQVLYVSNKEMFAGNIHYCSGKICLKQKTIALLTGSHFMNSRKPALSKVFHRKTFFKGDPGLKDSIDFLYSELSK